jgi:ubiquinone biosynthesis protein
VRTFLKHPRRVQQFLLVFLRFYVLPRSPFRRGRDPGGPVRLRMALETLGGAWIKLGQMLAMRFDLLPAAYCDELFKLLNQVQPFAYEQVSQIVREELGDVPEAVFRDFTRTSFAAASIGQVHRATLHSGEAVAVKVQRPGIREALQADIDLMYATSRLLDWIGVFGATRSRQVIDEFARWTGDELDYQVEARQAVLLYRHARGEPLERVARVYREYSTARVLTTELIEGIPLVDIIVAVREHDEAYLTSLSERGYDLDRVILHLDWNMLNQVYVFGYFHADLHPANLYVLPGNAIGYVDFGIVGQLPDRVRSSLTRYSWLLFRGEVESAIEELMRWLAPSATTNVAVARWQLIRIHQAFLYDTVRDGTGPGSAAGGVRSSAENPYLRLAVEIMNTIRDHELTLAPSLVAYLKMLVTLGTLRHELATDYDLPRHVLRFFRKLVRQQGVAFFDPRLTVDRLYAGGVRLQRAMEFLEFLEAQEPVIAAGSASLFGVRARLHAARRRLVSLGLAALVVGSALYLVLAYPGEARGILPAGMPYDVVHVALLLLLIWLIVSLLLSIRRYSRDS